MLLVRRISGKSLEPIYQHGQLVIGIRARRLHVGKAVLFEHEGYGKVKLITDIKNDKVFVEGSGRYSTDSRDFGWIDKALVKAVIIWPRPQIHRQR